MRLEDPSVSADHIWRQGNCQFSILSDEHAVHRRDVSKSLGNVLFVQDRLDRPPYLVRNQPFQSGGIEFIPESIRVHFDRLCSEP